jgi:hypothetical protein
MYGRCGSMDPKAARMTLIRDAMPGVAALVREKRALYGDAHVTHCIQQGMAGKPGWFFAREGTLAVGTPWPDDPVMENFALLQVTSTQALLIIREPGAADGAH